MGFFEGILFIIMAGATHRSFFMFKKIGFVGAMGKMTECARLFSQSLVDEFLFKSFFLVTLEAGLTPFGL